MKINLKNLLREKRRDVIMIIIILTIMITGQLMMNVKIAKLERVMKMKRLLSKRKKNIKKKNVTKTKLHRRHPQQTATKRHHRLYKQLIVFRYFIRQMVFVFAVLIIVKNQKNAASNACCASAAALNPLKDMTQVDEIDYTTDFDNLYSRMDDFNKFFNTGKRSYNILKYIPGLAKIGYQGQLLGTETKRKYADESYKNKKVSEFNIQLTANHYTKFQNVHLCFPIKIQSAADNNSDIMAGVIPVNIFFAHWIKEIDIKRYGDDIPVLPLTNTVDVYSYSDELLKHMPKDALKKTENDLLYSKKKSCNLRQ